jgi:hypothetical protein
MTDWDECEAEQLRLEAQRQRAEQSVQVEDRRSRQNSSETAAAVEDTKREIGTIRAAARTPEFQKNASVVELVISALKKRGRFYHDTLRSYFFFFDKRVLLSINRDELGLELLLHEYGLYPNETVTKQVIDGLRLEAHGRGRETSVHPFTYYDRERRRVYVYDFEGGVYRITENTVEHVDNGADDILFAHDPRWTPLRLTEIGGTFDWRSWLLNGLEFSEGTLSDQDQRCLVGVWVLTLFFPQLFPTRIILAILGEKGSGKSSLLRRLGKVLLGPQFNVALLTHKPDDFDAAVTTEPFVVADNADTAPGWFPDKLAVLATGGTLKRRLLYTTNKLGEFPVMANLAVTTRTPNFKREDIAERLLPLNVQRLDGFVPESQLLDEAERSRPQLVSAILGDVQRALREIVAEAGTTRPTQFRMADFADFAVKVAPVVGLQREEMQQLLNRVGKQQVAFAAEDEPLLDLIDKWLSDETTHVNIDREMSPANLAMELEELAGSSSVPWERGNGRSFAQHFRNLKGTLAQQFGMRERSSHGGRNLVSFPHRRGGLGGVGRWDSRSVPDLSWLLSETE